MILTHQLKKTYGNHEALKGIDLVVEPGDVYGFIGPNGAGKTTTIRILTTLLQPSEGTATIDGISVMKEPQKVRGTIGYMPDDFGVYQDMTVTEYLHFFAAAYGIDRGGRTGLVGGLLELVDLTVKADSLIDALSRGMQQRLGLARTLVHDPQVLILDEPASGLDPRARIEIREILRELQRMGKTILLSSHILSELESICTRIGILEQGELVAQGTVPEVIAQTQAHTEVRLTTTDDARAAVVAKEIPGVLTSEHGEEEARVELTVAHELDLAAITEHLAGRGIFVRQLERREPSLEDVFMILTRGAVS